jgi:hypothetical protein
MSEMPNIGEVGHIVEPITYGSSGTARFGTRTVPVQPVGVYTDLNTGDAVVVTGRTSNMARVDRQRS